MRHILVILLLGVSAGCTVGTLERHDRVSCVVEVRSFKAMERRAWDKDGLYEYDYHRLDIRVIEPRAEEGKMLSIFMPMLDWPKDQLVASGRMVVLRLKREDLEDASAPLFSIYRLADLQLSEGPNSERSASQQPTPDAG